MSSFNHAQIHCDETRGYPEFGGHTPFLPNSVLEYEEGTYVVYCRYVKNFYEIRNAAHILLSVCGCVDVQKRTLLIITLLYRYVMK